jgi:hypothetical protein
MYIVIPIHSDGFLHPLHKDNRLSLLYVKELGNEGRVLTFNHMDSLSTDSYEFLKDEVILTPSKKHLLSVHPFKKVYDMNMLNWWLYNKPMNLDIKVNTIDILNNRFYNLKNINTVIPIYKHLEYCNKVADEIEQLWEKRDKINFNNYLLYDKEAILAYYSIERKGIKVSDDVCEVFDNRVKKHISDNRLYSDYFLNTTTGRPSNSFGSVNFAALEPEKRKAFIPENDIFVEYDYDAYHLRIIADLVEYKFPEGSVHEYLAGWYGVDYDESKAITFRILYGGISEDIANKVPFFRKVKKFINKKWELFNLDKCVYTYIYNRSITSNNLQGMNANKVFNYLIQAHETELNIKTIIELQRYLLDKKTDLVLYGYDSFLFDFSKQDGEHILYNVKKILERNGHPVKLKQGYNYQEMN